MYNIKPRYENNKSEDAFRSFIHDEIELIKQ